MARSTITLAIIAVVALLPLLPAQAKDRSPSTHYFSRRVDPDLRTVTVSYADLNLRNEAGVARLTSRVKFAVRQVCQPMDDNNLAELYPTHNCIQRSMSHAKAGMAFAIARASSGERIAALEQLQFSARIR